MRLLIVSHTAHFRDGDRLVGWGPTVREIDHLATLFDEVVHVAPVHDEPPPASAMPYEAANVTVRAVHPSGGERLVDKVRVLVDMPAWARVIASEMRHADVMHVRSPANIAMVAMGLMTAVPSPRRRWLKFAGNWAGRDHEPLSYRVQREWARRFALHRAEVTVNGTWPDQAQHIHSFLNPCLTDEELLAGRTAAAGKRHGAPFRLLFVGRLSPEKGVDCILAAARRLVADGVAFELDLVGDSDAIDGYRQQAASIGAPCRIHGWLPRPAIGALYREAHLLLLPSASEGWPKVISEAMAYGVVPVATSVSSIPSILGEIGVGATIDGQSDAQLARSIQAYTANPARWRDESRRAVEAAPRFTYAAYLAHVRDLLGIEAP
jgi:glycosyltransferase involved in cell wall biosynthesis